jgi:hypothetical protein
MILQHQGFSHARILRNDGMDDTHRERSLAEAWEAQNPPTGQVGVQPVLAALIPDVTARDAQVAATVIQWLGSGVGFDFLSEALESAGYKVSEIKKRSA